MKKIDYLFLAVFVAFACFVLSALWIFMKWKIELFDIISWNVAILIIANELKNKKILKKEEQFLNAFEKFLSAVRHKYNAHGMIDEAVTQAANECKESLIKKQVIELGEVLKSENISKNTSIFINKYTNPFVKLFLTLCTTVMEFGDTRSDGQSTFLINIKQLKDEIASELTQIRIRRYKFSGMMPVIVIPLLALRIIENWGVENIEELSLFFEGKSGLLVRIIILVSTIVIYLFVNELKNYTRVRQVAFSNFTIKFSKRINNLLNNYILRHQDYVNKVRIMLAECCSSMDFKTFFVSKIVITFSTLFLSTYLAFRVSSDGFGLLQILIVSFLTILAFMFLDIFILYKRSLVMMGIEDEVMQFQSIIMILKFAKQSSTLRILEEIEPFAIYYKKPIRECINDYQSGDLKALRLLKTKARCDQMEQIVENLLISDDIGIEAAFEEIIPEKNYYREKRKQENAIQMDNKVLIAKLITFIPMFITIGGYLIIPFVMESMKMMEGFMI